MTVTDAVALVAMSDAEIAAVSSELLTNVVARGVPFQFTIDPDTNPAPFTANVKFGPPGATLVGTRGLLIIGTGFGVLCPVEEETQNVQTSNERASEKPRGTNIRVYSCLIARRGT